jgi:hypothetical protein
MIDVYGNHRVISRHTSGFGFVHALVEDLTTHERKYRKA